MSGILDTLGLTKNLKLTIDMDRSKFIEFLQKKVKPNRLFFFDIFDSEQKEFYGNVNTEKFWLRHKSQSLFPESPFASAEGKINSSFTKTELEIKIIGWNWFVIFWFVCMTLVLGLNLNDTLRTESYGVFIFFGPIFLILYMLAIYKMRKGVRKLENYLVTELK